jgi:hypothetical protein
MAPAMNHALPLHQRSPWALCGALVDCGTGPVRLLSPISASRQSLISSRMNQEWDAISIAIGVAVAVALAVILGVPIAKVIRDKLYDRQMRRHFSDTRGRRRRIEETTYWDDRQK